MQPQFANQPKPTYVNVIAWMTLASGIVNLVWGLVATLSFWWTIVCIPFLILPTVLGIFEVIYATKLLSNPPQVLQPSRNIAILEIIAVLAGNVFSVVVGILALVFYNDVTVQEYFARLNGTVPPAAVTPVPAAAPVAVVDPNPVPEEPPFPNEETPDR
jgi:hypothetical protein